MFLLKLYLFSRYLFTRKTNEASFEKIEGENTLTMFVFVLAFELLEQPFNPLQLDIFVAF